MACTGICDFAETSVTNTTAADENFIDLLSPSVLSFTEILDVTAPPGLHTQVAVSSTAQEIAVHPVSSEVVYAHAEILEILTVTEEVSSSVQVTSFLGTVIHSLVTAQVAASSDTEETVTSYPRDLVESSVAVSAETTFLVTVLDTVTSSVAASSYLDVDAVGDEVTSQVAVQSAAMEALQQRISTQVSTSTSMAEVLTTFLASSVAVSSFLDELRFLSDEAGCSVAASSAIQQALSATDFLETTASVESALLTLQSLWYTASTKAMNMSTVDLPMVQSASVDEHGNVIVVDLAGDYYAWDSPDFLTGAITVDLRSMSSLKRKKLEDAWVDSDYPAEIQATTTYGGSSSVTRMDESAKLKFGRGVKDTRINLRLEATGLSVRRIDLRARDTERRY